MSLFKMAAQKLSDTEACRLIQAETRRIAAACNPDCLILFGSGARNQLTESSDLDFIAVFNTPEQLKEAKERYFQTLSTSGLAVDVLFLTSEDFKKKSRTGGVCFVAAREGKIVFESKRDEQK